MGVTCSSHGKDEKCRVLVEKPWKTYMRNIYKILFRGPEGKRPCRRPRCQWEDNIRIDLRLGRCGLDASG